MFAEHGDHPHLDGPPVDDCKRLILCGSAGALPTTTNACFVLWQLYDVPIPSPTGSGLDDTQSDPESCAKQSFSELCMMVL